MPLEAGYSIQRVSADVNQRDLCHRVLNAARRRWNQGNLNSFVRRRRGSAMGLRSTSGRILWLGESKSTMTINIVV